MPFFFLALAILISNVSQAQPAADAPAKAAPESKPAPEVKTASVTRVVGEAGPRVVTSREVRINDAISQVLNLNDPTIEKLPEKLNEKVTPPKKKVIKIDDTTFPVAVLRVLDEWTVYLEATEIGSKTADKGEVARLAKVATDAWKGNADWEHLEASPTEIREAVERKLAAQSLERLKGDASLVNVSDAEALQYYKKNRLRFGNMPFDSFKENIKSAMVRTQTERRLVEWRAVLRRKYRVRNFVGA